MPAPGGSAADGGPRGGTLGWVGGGQVSDPSAYEFLGRAFQLRIGHEL
jgi:hypothetical protein